MKIATYNIMSGGFNGYDSGKKEPDRLNEIVKAVKIIDADIISLNDTYRWQDLFSEKDLQSLFGYPYAFRTDLLDERDFPVGIAVLTGSRVIRFEIIKIYDRYCLKTDIDLSGKTIHFYSLYLNYESEDVRVKEITDLLHQAEKNYTVIMGDFNTFNPEDVRDIKGRLEKIFRLMTLSGFFAEYQEKIFPAIGEMCQARTLPLLRAAGYLEAGDIGVFQPTVPTKIKYLVVPPLFQVDYIFHTPDIEVADFQVPKNPVFDLASDHYPVSCGIIVR